MRFLLAVTLCLLPIGAAAQDRAQSLADIRQELSVLYVQVQQLKGELSTTGLPRTAAAGTSTLERVDAIEQALQRLTAQTENLELRLNRVVADGTNRIGDLEFRLVELEGGDVSRLANTTTLGGDSGVVAPVAAPPATDGAQLAVGERADFDRAKAALDAGSFRSAESQFAAFAEAYPAGPLTGEAHFLRGEALASLGETAAAARAYLTSFSGSPDGAHAPDALLQLGLSLWALGQTQESCLTLGEVDVRFPGSEAASQAAVSRQNFNCL